MRKYVKIDIRLKQRMVRAEKSMYLKAKLISSSRNKLNKKKLLSQYIPQPISKK